MRPAVFTHPPFPDHVLVDSGQGEKLERYGKVLLRRPDPQALWNRRRPDDVWASADLSFERESDRGGRWVPRTGVHPDAVGARGADPAWPVTFGEARFIVRPTPFKHVGLFPEQAANWAFIVAARDAFEGTPRLLNLFGYTGAASVLAARAGYKVTHVDASRSSIAWAQENAEASGLERTAMRVICDDALAFARRERRRDARYEGILLDPPHYGRGPKGEKWQFETDVADLIEAVGGLLCERAFLILSTYAIGNSPLALANLLGEVEGGETEVGELALPEEATGPGDNGAPRRLPAGFSARWSRGLAPRDA